MEVSSILSESAAKVKDAMVGEDGPEHACEGGGHEMIPTHLHVRWRVGLGRPLNLTSHSHIHSTECLPAVDASWLRMPEPV